MEFGAGLLPVWGDLFADGRVPDPILLYRGGIQWKKKAYCALQYLVKE
jgi:hypothetical protein